MSIEQGNNLIKVSNVNKLFPSKQALKNVSFEINQGAPVALVGPNGAGKTTLFSILCGYIQQTSGEVSIMGHKPGSAATFGNLAALPQDAQLDPRFSIAHQLKFYGQLQGFNRKKSEYEAERTLDLVGLKEVLNEKPGALSHGMRKRVTIAQALIGEPKIVMLDEATAGLDPLHAREIRELVASLSGNTTFILSSHDLSELERLCQQVLYLENGVLKEHQTLANEVDLSYITLRMANVIPDFEQVLKSISQISDVKNTQDKEYLISVTPNENTLPIDIQILQLCHDKNWQYRQMINGKTLENQLFS
ncbi:ABC transporter ATP-binding protein [Pseudoalteromonas denitrificans]|uniref:ABC-type multidrug transport system, ATPase component n=1 Tax=Pseudoalteromonas denitrificans DSM 6059 TaxID=1123010 RepID=A0A1I1TZA4_9GAMM|nr:ABC transporter ATP-binding protein [Pseudoalteromonas denitrificans]SFD60950.1 ABC-type multidrug transport system, ATPase component [Pseudoalteromonas denitrificans DSM 6059]